MTDAVQGLLLCDDLIFTSRIVGTARDLGHTIKTVRTVGELRELLNQVQPACIVIDLANPGLVIADFMTAIQAIKGRRPNVIAYGSHVDTATLKAARTAGCDKVLTRSQFVEELPIHLTEWMTAQAEAAE